MSLHRHAAKRDQTEAAIVDALERCGFAVLRLSQPNVPDLLVSRAGAATLIEVKTGTKPLSKGQQAFQAWWHGPVAVLRSVEDALAFATGT